MFPAHATPANTQIGVVSDYDGGELPAIALTPNGQTIYVPHRGDQSVAIIDTRTNTQNGYVQNFTGSDPIGVGVSLDGGTAYVLNMKSPRISIINVETKAQIGTVSNLSSFDAFYFSSIAFSPDKKTAYISFGTSGTLGDTDPGIVVLDVTKNRQVGLIPPSSQGAMGRRVVSFSSNGDKAYATNPHAHTISVIDTKTNTETGVIKKWDGTMPWSVAYSPAGGIALVTSNDDSYFNGEISVVDVAEDEVIGTVNMNGYGCSNGGVSDLIFSPHGDTAYVLGDKCNQIYVVDVAAKMVKDVIHGFVGSDNWYPNWVNTISSMVVTPDGERLYIATPMDTKPDYIAIADLVPMASTVTTVSPSSGSVTGGTQITIKGANLTGTTQVDFGGVAGTGLKVVSDSEVTVTTPPHSVGSADVTVLNPGGNATEAGAYTYITAVSH